MPADVRDWLVGGGLVATDDGVLLVQNRRRDGRVDWSPPGGVIDEGETIVGGLTREVEEETGIRVTTWDGPIYRITAEAPDMGWRLVVEAHRATAFAGEVAVDDPDGIVVAAAFVAVEDCGAHLAGAPRWVREPLADWLATPWAGTRAYAYRVEGTLAAGGVRVHRTG